MRDAIMRDMNSKILMNNQRGAATLITSLIMLVAMTIITIFAARSAIMEQKIFSNEFRSKQSFEAAESGMELGVAYLLSRYGADKDFDDVIDTIDGDTVPTGGAAGNPSYTVSLTDNSGGLFSNVTVVSTGLSDDSSATSVITQIVALIPVFPNVPGNPLTSKGTVVVNGTADVINPEGNATIWTGAPGITFAGSGGTRIPDPSDPTVTIQSSDAGNSGPDVVFNDTNLSNMTDAEFFENFMGAPEAAFRDGPSVREVPYGDVGELYNDGTNPGTDLARREIIWVGDGTGTASYTGNTTVGCLVTVTGTDVCPANQIKPVLLVIDGNMSGAGTVKVYGMVYITGDFAGNGNLEVEGAVIMEGDVTGTGSLNVTYNSSVLGQLQQTAGAAAALPGSWRDF